MFETLKNAWRIADLRKKILFTVLIVAIFRVGAAIPVPFLDPTVIKSMIDSSGNLLGFLDVLTGGAFAQCTLFALSISLEALFHCGCTGEGNPVGVINQLGINVLGGAEYIKAWTLWCAADLGPNSSVPFEPCFVAVRLVHHVYSLL